VGERVTERLARIFREYIENYQRGYERFGFWWKLFTASMLALALIFVSFAIVLALRFLV
jgi:hypothetical protein